MRITLLSILLCAAVRAAADGDTTSMRSLELDHVVVTSTRTPVLLKDAPVVTQLITSEDIRHSDATHIQDLLTSELPGLEFGYAMSQETSLSLNGFGGNAVLFLVDGERLAGETMDNVDYNRLNLINTDRVEVVKGAASALYGANAVAGVVNLISKDDDTPWSATASTRYHSMGDEWRHAARLHFRAGRWTSQTSVQKVRWNTVRLTSPFDTQSNIHQRWGGQSLNVSERVKWRPSGRLELTARGGYFTRESDRDTFADHYYDYSGGIKAEAALPRGQRLEVSYSYDQYDKARFASGHRTHNHDYSNRQHIARALYSVPFAHGRHTLMAGAGYMSDQLSTYQFDDATRLQHSADAFAQFDYNPTPRLNAVGSVRYDYMSASRSEALTARLAAIYKHKLFSLRASYAGGFRAPSLKEMHMTFDMVGIMTIYGNKSLKPEKSHNLNLAIEHGGRVSHGALAGSYSATLAGSRHHYNRRITHADFAGDEERAPGLMYCNADGVTVWGVDAAVRYHFNMGLGLKLNYTFMRILGESTQTQLTQPRPHSATFRVEYQHLFAPSYAIHASLSGRYMGKPSAGPDPHSYTIWNLNLQNRLLNGISINVTVDNLLNYRPAIYYWSSPATTGTSLSFGLSLDVDKIRI